MNRQLALLPGAARSYALRNWNQLDRSFDVVASTRNPILCSEWDPKTESMVSYYESLESWDMSSRYAKNPLLLDLHDSTAKSGDAVIGTGEAVAETDKGLEMRVKLASLRANERTQVIEDRIKEGLLRGVSVGWDYGERRDDTYKGLPWRRYYNNKLTEVSLCPIPKDEDALVESETRSAEEQERDRVSAAGRALAQARMRARVGDDAEGELVFDTGGSVGEPEAIAAGGLRIPARITRVGVLTYKKEGRTIRQLRMPSEVFNSDSLRTLQSAPITDMRFHNGFIDPSTWKERALGHVEAIRKDGDYVVGDVIVNDGEAVADVQTGKYRELSAGYRCRLEWTPGVWNGEAYDCIQRDIVYNHVALLEPGKGRCGPDVALLMDAASVEINDEENPMTATVQEKRIINFDGKDYDYGSESHVKAIYAHFDAKLVEMQGLVKTATENFDKSEARAKAAEDDKKAAEDNLKKEKESSRARMKSRLKLIRAVANLLKDDEDGEDEEEKMDSLFDATDREIMEKALAADENYGEKFVADSKDRSDAFIEGCFDAVCRRGLKRADGVDSVVKAVESVKRESARTPEARGTTTIVADAMEEQAKQKPKWQQPLAMSKG